jgi:hypothetical protein
MNRTYILVGVVICAVIGVAVLLGLSGEAPPLKKQNGPATLAPLKKEAQEANPAAKAPEAKIISGKPSFDVVRIEPDGSAVIAGRAAPGAKVTLFNGDTLIGSVMANEKGEWAFVPGKPLRSGSTELRIVAQISNGEKVESDHVVVLKIPDKAQSGENALVVLMPRGSQGASKVLQSPKPGPGIRKGSLTLDIIDYDEKGKMTFGGRGDAGASLHVFADNKALAQTMIDDQGAWKMQPEKVLQPGTYTLRLDQLKGGKITARIEAPFTRSPPLEHILGNQIQDSQEA